MKITLDRTYMFYWFAVLGLLFIILFNTRDTHYIHKLESENIRISYKAELAYNKADTLIFQSFEYGYRKALRDVTTGCYNPKIATDSFRIMLKKNRNGNGED
ncbi:MAG: hypothetical protein WC974_09320 [Thermoplasmata archaeon]